MTNTLNTSTQTKKGRSGSSRARHFGIALAATFAFAAIAPAASLASNGLSNVSNSTSALSNPVAFGTVLTSSLPTTVTIYAWSNDFLLSGSRNSTFTVPAGSPWRRNGGSCGGTAVVDAGGSWTSNLGTGTGTRSCSIILELKSGNTAGAKSATITTSGYITTPINLTATVADPAPAVQIWNSGNTAQETSHSYGDVISGSSSANYTFTVKNTGNVALTNVSTQSLTGTNASEFSIVSTTCGASLAVAATCNIVTKFNAGAVAGSKAATLTVTPGNSGVSAAQTTLSGNSLAQTYTATAQTTGGADLASYSFADTIVGNQSSTYTFNVKNTGNTAATFAGDGSSVALSGSNTADYAITANTCNTSVAANATCAITVRFNPSTSDPNAAGGARSATLTVTPSNTADGTNKIATADTVSLSGNAVAQTRLPGIYNSAGDATETSHNYGSVGAGTPAPYVFTLKNTGNFTLQGTGSANQSITGDQASDYSITATTCGTSIAPGGSCTITVTFNPTDAGTRNATLSVATTDGNGEGGATVTSTLTGEGVTSTFIPSLYDGTSTVTDYAFADTVGTLVSATHTFTLKNEGTGTLTGVDQQSITGTDADQFHITATTCSAAGLGPQGAANDSCTITVRFNPTTAGSKAAVITVATTNGTPANVSINLTGNSVQAVQTPSTFDGSTSISSYAFADTIATQNSATKTITLKNTGNVVLSGVGSANQAITGDNASDFAITATTCTTADLAVNGTCTITVRFNPATQGSKTAHLVITPTDRTYTNSSVATVDLSGTALEATQTATIQDTAGTNNLNTYAFADTTAAQLSAVYTFTLRNTGNVTLNGIGTAGQSLTGTNSTEFTITATTCSTGSLAPNATCTISARFNPATTSVDSAKTANLVVTPTGRTNVTTTGATLVLNGNVIGIKKIPSLFDTAGTTPTSSYTFPSTIRTQSNSYTFVLKNTGNTTLNGTAAANQSVTGTDAGNYSITSTTCTATLAANATCNIVVRFLPTTMGTKSANLVVNTTDGTSNNPATIALSGAVIQDTPTLGYYDTAGTTPLTTKSFGTVNYGSNSAYTLVLKNTGNVPITNPSTQAVTGTNAAKFVRTSTTCTTSLAVNATCNIVVTYTPTQIVNDTATLTVTGTEANKAITLSGSGGGIHVLNNGTQSTNGSTTSRQWQDTIVIGAASSYNNTFRAAFDVAVPPGRTITDVLVNPSSATSDTDPGGTYQYVTGTVKVYQQPGGGGHVYVTAEQPMASLTGWATGLSSGLLGLCIGQTEKTTNRRIFFKLKDDLGNLTPALPANVGVDDAAFSCSGAYPLLYNQSVASVNGVNAPSGTREAVTTPGTPVVYSFQGHGASNSFNGYSWRIRNAATGAMFALNASDGWNTCAAPCTSGSNWIAGKSIISTTDGAVNQLTVRFPSRGRWVVEAQTSGNSSDGNAVQYIGTALVNSEAGATTASSPQISVSGAPTDHPNTNSSWTMTASLTDTSNPTNTYDSLGGAGASVEWDLNNNSTDGPNADGFETRTVPGYALTASDLTQTLDLTGATPGPYTVRARVTDNGALSAADPSRASKIYSKTFTINTPPVATSQTVDVQADDTQPANITLAGTDVNGDSLTFGIPNTAGTGTISADSGTGASRTYSWPTAFTGHDTYTFVANDGHNATGNGTLNVRVHPNTQIDSGAPTQNQATKTTTAHFEFSSPQSPISGYECRVLNDGTVIRAWASCSTGSTGSTDYSDLPDGVNRFEVRAVNADGQSDGTPAAYEWRVDNTVPTVNVNGPRSNQSTVQPRPTNDTTPSYTFTVNDRSPQATITYECKLAWGPEADVWHSCGGASSSSGSGTVDIVGSDTPFGITADLEEGTYSFQIRATDEVGNLGPAKTETFKIDTTNPVSSFSGGAEGLINLRDPRFVVNSNEAGSTFHCRLVGVSQGEVFNAGCPGINGTPAFSGLGDDVTPSTYRRLTLRPMRTQTQSLSTLRLTPPSQQRLLQARCQL